MNFDEDATSIFENNDVISGGAGLRRRVHWEPLQRTVPQGYRWASAEFKGVAYQSVGSLAGKPAPQRMQSVTFDGTTGSMIQVEPHRFTI